MERNAEKTIPAVATHPGSILRAELGARGIKQREFAKTVGIPEPHLSEIINGKRNISITFAIRLEAALGIPAQTWINLQGRYHYVKKRQAEAFEKEVGSTPCRLLDGLLPSV